MGLHLAIEDPTDDDIWVDELMEASFEAAEDAWLEKGGEDE